MHIGLQLGIDNKVKDAEELTEKVVIEPLDEEEQIEEEVRDLIRYTIGEAVR